MWLRLEDERLERKGKAYKLSVLIWFLIKAPVFLGKKKKGNICDECQMSRGNRYLLCRIELYLAIEQFFIGAVDNDYSCILPVLLQCRSIKRQQQAWELTKYALFEQWPKVLTYSWYLLDCGCERILIPPELTTAPWESQQNTESSFFVKRIFSTALQPGCSHGTFLGPVERLYFDFTERQVSYSLKFDHNIQGFNCS